MRYFCIILFLFFVTNSFAETIIVYNKSTAEVVSVSQLNDAVVPDGYTSKTIKDTIRNDELLYPVSFYKLNGNKLDIDAKKVNSFNEQKVKEQSVRDKAQADKLSAMSKLKTLGLTEEEIQALIQ